MHELRDRGLALTIVSHNLDEIMEHSDVITVFRDGAVVDTRPGDAWTKHEMVDAMLGDHTRGADIASGHHQTRRSRAAVPIDAAPALVVKDLTSPGIIEGIDFELRPGEVLGISGLVGSGRTSILRALAGLDPHATGEVHTAAGSISRVPRSAREARRRGIALLPEDRKGQGLLLGRSGRDNVTLGEWGGVSRGGFISEGRLGSAAAQAAKQVGFTVSRLGEDARLLSGGNQQKLMIARWMHSTHPVLLADEPTRGVDVGAKTEILVALEKIVAQGRSMVVVSSELEEVIGLSDRVLVIDQGRVLALLDGAVEKITPAKVLQIIFDAAEPVPLPEPQSVKE
jgi:ABC-type sugar transport system ATPase subunit